jgi:hypothetical protein
VPCCVSDSVDVSLEECPFMAKLWHSGQMTKFNLISHFVFRVGMGQKFGDAGQSGKIAASLPVAANSIVRIAQIRVDEMTKRAWTVGRKTMRMTIRRRAMGYTLVNDADIFGHF